MASNKSEMRGHARYQVEDNAIVVGQSIVGQVVNLSLGGMMFRFLADSYSFPELICTVDIYWGGNNICLRKIPVQTIFNRPEVQTASNFRVKMQQCGLQFKKINRFQGEQLKYLLAHRTVGGE